MQVCVSETSHMRSLGLLELGMSLHQCAAAVLVLLLPISGLQYIKQGITTSRPTDKSSLRESQSKRERER